LAGDPGTVTVPLRKLCETNDVHAVTVSSAPLTWIGMQPSTRTPYRWSGRALVDGAAPNAGEELLGDAARHTHFVDERHPDRDRRSTGHAIALTIGRTIYIDRDGAGGGWTNATLYDAIKQELGHILGAS
jgi:hypothetical protein